jgi:O-antigen/teichoic acid export membrane protein
MSAGTAVITAPGNRLLRGLRGHLDLLTNSGSLMAATVVTSALGFVYWWLAARTVSAEAVGSASAAVSAMSLIGTLGMFGMGTMLLSELPRMRRRRANLISAAVLVSGVAAAVGSAGYLLLAEFVIPGLRAALPSTADTVLLVAGVSITAMTLVLDEGLVGLLAGHLQLMRNAYFAVVKLILLAVLVLAPLTITGGELLATWVAGAVLSIGGLLMTMRARGQRVSARPRLSLLRGRWRQALDHNLLNMALFLPRAALPLVVTATLSTRATAGFYTAWMVMTFVAMIPSNLATTLLAVAGDTAESLRGKVRTGLGVALGLGLPLSLITAVAARPIMGVFGPQYAAEASGALTVLALTYLPMAARQFYVAISRMLGRTRRASLLALLAGAGQCTAATYGASQGGLTSLALWLAGGFLIEGLLMTPTVVRVARHGAARCRSGAEVYPNQPSLPSRKTVASVGGVR